MKSLTIPNSTKISQELYSKDGSGSTKSTCYKARSSLCRQTGGSVYGAETWTQKS